MESKSVFVLISNFDNKIKCLNVSNDVNFLIKNMKKIAKNNICDEIGKNNFVDTLDGEEFKSKEIEECPKGYVLKYGTESGAIKRVDVNFTELSKGWVKNSTSVNLKGYYAVFESDNCDMEYETKTTETSSKTTADKISSAVRNNYNSVLESLFVEVQKRRNKIDESSEIVMNYKEDYSKEDQRGIIKELAENANEEIIKSGFNGNKEEKEEVEDEDNEYVECQCDSCDVQILSGSETSDTESSDESSDESGVEIEMEEIE